MNGTRAKENQPSVGNERSGRKRDKLFNGHENKKYNMQSGRSKSDDRGKRSRKHHHNSGTSTINDDFIIPPPTRKYTTTNPSTMSPIYHLFYDLTNPAAPGADHTATSHAPSSSLGAQVCNNPDIKPSTSTTKESSVFLPSSTSHQKHAFLQHEQRREAKHQTEAAISESNVIGWDGPKPPLPARNIAVTGLNAGNYRVTTTLPEKGPSLTAVNRKDVFTVSESSARSINGDAGRAFTCHFTERGQPDRRGGWEEGDSNNWSNASGGPSINNNITNSDRNNAASSVIENRTLPSSVVGGGDSSVASAFTPTLNSRQNGERRDTLKSATATNYDVNLGSADAAGISASLAFQQQPPPRPPRRRNAPAIVNVSVENKNSTQQVEETSARRYNVDDDGRHNAPLLNAVSDQRPTSVSQSADIDHCTNRYHTKDLDINSESEQSSVSQGLSVKQAVSLWNNNVNSNKDLRENISDNVDNAKRAVFQREGDSVRLFIVPDPRPVVSQQTHISSHPIGYHNNLSSGDLFKGAVSSSDNVDRALNSVDKLNKGEGVKSSKSTVVKRTDSKSRKFPKLLGGGGKKEQTKGKSPPVAAARKPINRWDAIHVLTGVGGTDSAPSLSLHAGQTSLTKEQSCATSGVSNNASVNQAATQVWNVLGSRCENNFDPDRKGDGTTGYESGTFTNDKPALKGILVNKDNSAGGTSVGRSTNSQGHKANTVQFVDDTLLQYNLHNSNTNSSLLSGVNSAHTSSESPGIRRDVIDRNKYIIKPREVKGSEHFLNRSIDSVLADTPTKLTTNYRRDALGGPYPQQPRGGHQLLVDTQSGPRSSITADRNDSDQQLSSRNIHENLSTCSHLETSNRSPSPLGHSRGYSEQCEQGGHATHSCSNPRDLYAHRKQKEGGNASPHHHGLSERGNNSSKNVNPRALNSVPLETQAFISSTVHSTSHSGLLQPANQLDNPSVTSKPSGFIRSDSARRYLGNSPVASDSNDSAGEETLSYRQSLRQTCKKSQLLTSPSVREEINQFQNSEQQLKHDTSTSLTNKPEALRLDLSGGESHPPAKPPKITPRQKFEIRHSRVSEKVAANLRHNPIDPDPDESVKPDNWDNSVPSKNITTLKTGLLSSVYKESPRARFERDRAARANAVCYTGQSSSGAPYPDDRLNQSCDELDIDTSSQSKLKCDISLDGGDPFLSLHSKPPSTSTLAAALSPRVGFSEGLGVQRNTIRDPERSNEGKDYDKRFDPVSKSTWINNDFTAEQATSRYHLPNGCVPNSAGTVPYTNEQTNQDINVASRSAHSSEYQELDSEGEPNSKNKGAPLPVSHSIPVLANNIDIKVYLSSGATGVLPGFTRDPNRTSVTLSQCQQSERNIQIVDATAASELDSNHKQNSAGDHSGNYRSSSKYSGDSIEKKDLQPQNGPALPPRVALQGYRRSANPAALTDGSKPLLGAAVKKMSPDSVSSSGYESEHNSTVLNSNNINNNVRINNIKNNLFNSSTIGVSKTAVEQLRLRFGHQAKKQTDQTLNASSPFRGSNINENSHRNPNVQNRFLKGDQISVATDENNNTSRSPPGGSKKERRSSSTSSKATSQSSSSSKRNSVDKNSKDRVSPKDKNKKRLENVNKSMHGIINDLEFEGCGRSNCKRVLKNSYCSKCAKKANRGSPSKSDSRSNSVDTTSDPGRLSKSPVISPTLSPSTNNSGAKVVSGFNSSSFLDNRYFFSLDDCNMLASKGLRIYESGGEYIAMKSPAKSPLQKSVSAPHFQWESATYLIMPTVVGSLSPPATNNSNAGDELNTMSPRNDLMAQRSISDSGASEQRFFYARGDEHEAMFRNRYSDTVDICGEAYLSMASSLNKSNLNNRAMSVDVLYAESSSLSPQTVSLSHVNSEDIRHSRNFNSVQRCKDKNHNTRGYVEWRTCSGWVGNTDMRKSADGRNSRGYVEWDTIWTAAAPWSSSHVDDEHVYDVIAEDHSSHSFEDSQISPGGRVIDKHTPVKPITTSVPIDTPPALPERTYINRLKQTKPNGQRESPASSSHSHSSCQSHSSNGGRKHHHHHHHHRHHHHHHQQQQQHNSPQQHQQQPQNKNKISSNVHHTIPPPSSTSSSQFKPQSKISQFHSSSSESQLILNNSANSDNYAQVCKLKGYKFTNLMNSFTEQTDPPTLDNKSAIYSENYWHLGPVSSPDRVSTWQTGDVLDYIDGLHDSMSPKRRENIYILLNNKKTRAKFSESLEIESRLLSKGLLPSAHDDSSDGSRKDDLSPSTEVKEFQPPPPPPIAPGVKKKPRAPVSSTYV